VFQKVPKLAAHHSESRNAHGFTSPEPHRLRASNRDQQPKANSTNSNSGEAVARDRGLE
jgi:hypothetical protein